MLSCICGFIYSRLPSYHIIQNFLLWPVLVGLSIPLGVGYPRACPPDKRKVGQQNPARSHHLGHIVTKTRASSIIQPGMEKAAYQNPRSMPPKSSNILRGHSPAQGVGSMWTPRHWTDIVYCVQELCIWTPLKLGFQVYVYGWTCKMESKLNKGLPFANLTLGGDALMPLLDI